MKSGETLELGGRWQFRQAAGRRWLPAAVPGSVHSDLLRLGKIKDPFVYPNEARAQWIENVGWEYRREFSLTPGQCARDGIDLICEGLDTYATVLVNGREVARTDNMHRPYAFDVKSYVRAGANELRVVFDATLPRAKKEIEYYLPSRTDVSEVVPWVRKAAYQFGWDWCPRLVTSGIWRPIRLELYDGARIGGLITQQRWRGGDVRLEVRARLQVAVGGRYRLTARVAGVEGTAEASLGPGEREVRLELAVRHPRRWWPNGYGRQPLYTLEASLRRDGRAVDSAKKRMGFRAIRLVQKKDRIGRGFHFEVNGVPVWAKGANWVPLDSLPDRASTPEGIARTRDLLKSCAAANFNMLRVWGGGVYETDAFYEACDELGLMVFQDFMYACHQYPGTRKFLDNARREAEGQVWRLADHPSVALWCGNNEIEQGWAYWGWRHSMPQRFPDFLKLFCRLLPGVIKKLDPARDYWPCSESSGPPYGRHPKDPRKGDVHYWGVSVRSEPIEKYKELRARFVAEFGFSSFPPFDELKRVIPPRQLRLASPALEDRMKWPSANVRDQFPNGNRVLEKYLADYTGIPEGAERGGAPFERAVYLSQVLQGFAIQTAVEAWRRYKPYCMGALYWQVNSCWPEIGWASLSYDGQWKALHYLARRFFAPVLASADMSGSSAALWVTNDVNERIKGELRWWLRDMTGRALEAGGRTVALSALGNVRALDLDFQGHDPRRVFLHYRFKAGRYVSENVAFFTGFKDLALPASRVTARPITHRSRPALRVSANGPAFFICLTAPGVRFGDNYFHLPTGGDAIIALPADTRLGTLASGLKVTGLNVAR